MRMSKNSFVWLANAISHNRTIINLKIFAKHGGIIKVSGKVQNIF